MVKTGEFKQGSWRNTTECSAHHGNQYFEIPGWKTLYSYSLVWVNMYGSQLFSVGYFPDLQTAFLCIYFLFKSEKILCELVLKWKNKIEVKCAWNAARQQFLLCSCHGGWFLFQKPLDTICRQAGKCWMRGRNSVRALLFAVEFPASTAQNVYGLAGLYSVI